MLGTNTAIVKPFMSNTTDLPLGACWQSEDVDGNKAIVFLSRVEDGHNVYRWLFRNWDGSGYTSRGRLAAFVRHSARWKICLSKTQAGRSQSGEGSKTGIRVGRISDTIISLVFLRTTTACAAKLVSDENARGYDIEYLYCNTLAYEAS